METNINDYKLMSESHDKAYAMLREGYNREWKKHSPARAKLNKKEDVAFVRAQKRKLFESRQNIDKQDLKFYNIKQR